MTTSRLTRQFLLAMEKSGVTHLPKVNLPDLRPRVMQQLKAKSAGDAPVARRKSQTEVVKAPAESEATSELLKQYEAGQVTAADGLTNLANQVSSCQRCEHLVECRTQTVFGVGNPSADIMFVGEAPGADEDRQGIPFVGKAGQLLDRIIVAAKLKRDDLYICNVLRCRPPGNRNPTPQEIANCREYLEATIRIVNPRYIVCWGTVAAQTVLKEQRSVGKLRGSFFSLGDAKVLCTYHPSYLLRYEPAKKQVWADMKLLMAELGIEA